MQQSFHKKIRIQNERITHNLSFSIGNNIFDSIEDYEVSRMKHLSLK